MTIMAHRIRCKAMGPVPTKLPAYGRDGDAGLDLSAAISGRDVGEMVREGEVLVSTGRIVDGLCLGPGGRAIVPVGWAFEIPDGYEGQVRGRSGWSSRGLSVVLGTVDANFRGEVSAHVHNISGRPITIRHGDRIAQLVIAPVLKVGLVQVGAGVDLEPTSRGSAGFGSSGD